MSGALSAALIGSEGSKSAARTSARATDRATEATERQYEQSRQDLEPWMQVARGTPIYGERTLTGYETDAFGRQGAPIYDEAPITGYTGGALQELAGYGRSKVKPEDFIPGTNIPKFDPSSVDVNKDPGAAFRRGEQERQIDRASAGMGKLLSGNRLEELMQRSGELASQEYGAAYGRAKGEYGLEAAREADVYGRGVDAYGRALGEETGYLNRLSGLANVGQQATMQSTQLGAGAASNIGANIRAGGQAQAAGQLGQAAAWQSGLGDLGAWYARQQQPQVPTGSYSAAPTTPYDPFNIRGI